MIVLLLVAILAVLLFGAPQILERGMQGGAIALGYVAAFIVLASVVSFVAAAVHGVTDALALLFFVVVMAGWVWALMKFKASRWPSAVALFVLVVIVQLWPVARALAG